MLKNAFDFEQGPIRPPNEARSLLLRITRNCPWNRCLFCPVYKRRKFSLRTVEEIKEDIQKARGIADEIRDLSRALGCGGEVNDLVVNHVFSTPRYGHSDRSVAAWLHHDTGACFLQDADNLVMKSADLIEVLRFLKDRFPEITRITTYARSRTLVRKTPANLREIRAAGLNRVHVGLESGCDAVLKLVKKGVTADQHVEAGRRVLEAGMELSEYVMPGLGGQDLWQEHAEATAEVLNRINPHFIRLRSLRIPARVRLSALVADGTFRPQTDDRLAEEVRVFVAGLEGIGSVLTSDHIMNLMEDVAGKLPDDKEKMLEAVKRYQALPDSERLIYRVGRRGGAYRSVSDLRRDPATYEKIKGLIRELKGQGGMEAVDRFITEVADQYV